jgi:hypothetical protein
MTNPGYSSIPTHSEEEYIDIEEILRPQIPTSDQKKGKQVENKPRAVTRSRRGVKVVDKDNF